MTLLALGTKACDVMGGSVSGSVSAPSSPSSLLSRVLFPRADVSGSGAGLLDRNMASCSASSSGVRMNIAPSLRSGRGTVGGAGAGGAAGAMEDVAVEEFEEVVVAIVGKRG